MFACGTVQLVIERYEPVTETIDALHKGTGDILDSGFVETIMDSWKDTSTKMVSPYVE